MVQRHRGTEASSQASRSEERAMSFRGESQCGVALD